MPKIFVSYRREDLPFATTAVYNDLVHRYGGWVFRDIDNIGGGEHFREKIGTALRQCGVVVAVIGPGWLGPLDGGGTRIRNEDDWIRAEIEMASFLGIPIVPVLVREGKEKGKMPSKEQLPASLSAFPNIQGLEVESGGAFRAGMDRVIAAIDEALARAPPVFEAIIKNILKFTRGTPPPFIIACGAIAWFIGWLMMQWYHSELQRDEDYSSIVSALGPLFEGVGVLVIILGVILWQRFAGRVRRN